MSDTPYLSRVRLRRDAPAAALRELLLPQDDGRRIGAGHRLMWTLFADRPDRERDFLWREGERGMYYILSKRPPEDRHQLFEVDPPKLFAPQLSKGDRLAFALRANATVSKMLTPGKRGKPVDVVMAAIREVQGDARAGARVEAVSRESAKWLQAQGNRCGFALVEDSSKNGVRVSGYRVVRVEHAGPEAHLGVLDMEGVIEVTDPAVFVDAIRRGFGRAKAFGCGLMLIRRA